MVSALGPVQLPGGFESLIFLGRFCHSDPRGGPLWHQTWTAVSTGASGEADRVEPVYLPPASDLGGPLRVPTIGAQILDLGFFGGGLHAQAKYDYIKPAGSFPTPCNPYA